MDLDGTNNRREDPPPLALEAELEDLFGPITEIPPSAWEARDLLGVGHKTRRRPLQIICWEPDLQPLIVDGVNLRAEWAREERVMFVKVFGVGGMTEQCMFAEYFGNQLARLLGVPTPEPALVHLGPQFVAAHRVAWAANELIPREGLAVGCRHLGRGLVTTNEFNHFTAAQIEQVVRILAFDLLVQNRDRNDWNPNSGYIGEHLFAYDFELCFDFLGMESARVTPPWQVSNLGIAQTHVFREAVRRRRDPGIWEPFIQDLQALTPDRVLALVGDAPPRWQFWAEQVWAHLEAVITRIADFRWELRRCVR